MRSRRWPGPITRATLTLLSDEVEGKNGPSLVEHPIRVRGGPSVRLVEVRPDRFHDSSVIEAGEGSRAPARVFTTAPGAPADTEVRNPYDSVRLRC